MLNNMHHNRLLLTRLWLHQCAGSTASSSIRHFAAAAATVTQQPAFLAFLQEELAALSIPAGELRQLARSGLSDAALTAWALTKTRMHPAAEQAAAATQRLQHLLSKLEGALLRQQGASSSPTAELLWRVALAAAQQQLRGMPAEDLESAVEYKAVCAALRQQKSQGQAAVALQKWEQLLPQLVDTSPRNALSHPAFWQLAAAAAKNHPGLPEDLQLCGYDVGTAAAAAQQLEEVQQLLGLDVALLQQQLLEQVQAGGTILLPEHTAHLLQAASGSTTGRALLGQLQLVEVLAAALGRTAVQLTMPPSSSELVARLTGQLAAHPELTLELTQALQAAAPQLVAAVQQLSAASLAQPGVAGLLQLMQGKPELQACHKALTAWRAEAAAAGSLPVLSSLSQAEVSGLSKAQAQAVGRAVMQLEAGARLVMRQAAAGGLDLAGLSPSDTQALAWRVHTGGTQAAEEVVQLVLLQAAQLTAAAEAEAAAGEGALAALSAGFELEEATSRRSTAAPPSAYVMAGLPQMQVADLIGEAGDGSRQAQQPSRQQPSSSSSSSVSVSGVHSAEALIRDLALLLAGPPSSSSTSSNTVPAFTGVQEAVMRLQVVAADLPRVLSQPLLELLSTFRSGEVPTDADSINRRQQLLHTYMQAAAAELPRQLQEAAANPASGSHWASQGELEGASAAAAGGLLELLGEEDSGQLLDHGAGRRNRHGRDGDADPGHLYGWLSNIHHDQDMQRCLQIEFDPALEVDVVHTPRGWQDPDLLVSAPDFLEAMRPLLDTYLAAQGEEPLQNMEWQVYRDAVLAESEQVEAEAAVRRHAAGQSPFYNSRADEAFLVDRLDAGIPQDSVLYAAAHKYLAASFKNPTWSFAQRKRMADVLIGIAAHLTAHPPRSHRGSPFSALFLPDGPPLVPRISTTLPVQDTAEAVSLPPGFGAAQGTAAQPAGS